MRDAIDFEALVQADEHVAAMSTVAASAERRTSFLDWVDERRAQSSGTLPGERYERGYRIVAPAAIVTGLVLGIVLAGGLLSRNESEPINALLFLGGSVGLQVVVVLLVAGAWLLGKIGVRVQPLRDAVFVIVGLFVRLFDRLDRERRSALQARWAEIDLRSGRLGPLIACQTLIVTQCFAVAFNGGLLAALLLVYLPFVELRFGWQSTYSVGPDQVAAGVRVVAAPWSWISETLVPSAAEIGKTRYTRGQAAGTLPADAARAWWPFLVSAIMVYGLLFRAVLAIIAAGVLRSRLDRFDIAHPAANAVWRRLTGPLMASQPNQEQLSGEGGDASRRSSFAAAVLVIDDELGGQSDELRARLERSSLSPIGPTIMANIDDDALHEDLAAALRARGTSVAVVTHASRDPLVAVADFLRALVAAARPDAEVTVVLMGDEDLRDRITIWSRFVAIQRLRVGVAGTA